jgi:hypothetical protein
MNYCTFTILAMAIMFGFILGGFYGVALIALGLIGSPIMLQAINNSASILITSAQFSVSYRKIPIHTAQFLRNASWSAKSQLIFIQVLNLGGIFLADIALIGAIFIVSKTSELNFFDSFVFDGVS